MVLSLERHRDKDIRAGGTADAAANWGAGREGGEFTILRTGVMASKSKEKDQSDPHVAELSTQQQQKICREKFRRKKEKKGVRCKHRPYYGKDTKNGLTDMTDHIHFSWDLWV
jgi:hypothetical protein